MDALGNELDDGPLFIVDSIRRLLTHYVPYLELSMVGHEEDPSYYYAFATAWNLHERVLQTGVDLWVGGLNGNPNRAN